MGIVDRLKPDSWMMVLFFLVWSVFLWGFHTSFIARSLSSERPASIAGFPVNIVYVILVTFALVLLPYIFTRHIDFDRVRSPETQREFKWEDDR